MTHRPFAERHPLDGVGPQPPRLARSDGALDAVHRGRVRRRSMLMTSLVVVLSVVLVVVASLARGSV